MPASASHDSADTSPSLLARIRVADQSAWARLVHVYSPLVYAWCRRAGLSAEDAADVMQDVWAAVSVAVPRFDATAGGSFRGWLYTICRNKVIDLHRRRSGRPLAEGGSTALGRLAELPDTEPDESLSDPHTGSTAVLHRAVEIIRGDFEPTTFRAFWATAVECRPAAAVAAELGVSAAVVYQSKSRVLRRLKQEFEGLVRE